MKPITIILDGVPVAKGRARFGRGRAYTPAQTRGFQASFGWAAKTAMVGRQPLTCAVKVVASFELPIPSSWSARLRVDAVAGTIRPTTKPDTDNLLKVVLDAINCIVVDDDARVVDVSASTIYSDNPKTVVTISPHTTEE